MNGIIKKTAFLIIALLMVPLSLRAAQQEYYTVIAGTYRLQANAGNVYKTLKKSIPGAAFLRIERNGKFYTVRVGRSLDKSGAERFLAGVRSRFKDARLLHAFYKSARIIRINDAGRGHAAASLADYAKAEVAGQPALSPAAARQGRHEILSRHLKKWVQNPITPVVFPPDLARIDKQFFTVQLASFIKESVAHKEINRLRGLRFSLPWLRVERIQRFFTVRAGRFSTRRQAVEFMRLHGKKIKGRILTVYIRPERIIELYGASNDKSIGNVMRNVRPSAVSHPLRAVLPLTPVVKKIKTITACRHKIKAVSRMIRAAAHKLRHKAGAGTGGERREFFTLQAASFKTKKMALRAYMRLRRHKDLAPLSDLRVELVASYFTLRAGKFVRRLNAVKLADSLRRFYPGLLVMRAYVLEKRIVQISGNARGGEKQGAGEKPGKLKSVHIAEVGAVKMASRPISPEVKTTAVAVDSVYRGEPAAEAVTKESRGGRESFIFKAAGNTEIKAPVKQKVVRPDAEALGKSGENPLLHSIFAATNLEDKDLSYEVVTIIGKDDRGNKIRMPSSLFYDRHRDELYAINGVNNRIIVYGADYFPQNSLGKGRGIDSPMGGFIAKDGKIYITQAGAVGSLPRITVLNGAFMPEQVIAVSKMPDSSGFIPQKITINANGRFYVTGLHSKKVLVLDRNGNFLRWFHVAIDKKGNYFFSGFDTPLATAYIRDVVSDSLGNLFFLSEETSKVYAFNTKEIFLFSFGVKGGAKGKLSRPRGLCIDEGRHCFYVVDYMRHEVLIYDFTGKFRHEFGGRGWGAEWFNYPVDIVLGARHQVVVADFFNQQIKVFKVKWRETFPARPDSLWKLK